MSTTPTPALLRLPAVIATVGLSRTQIYRLVGLGQFPAQVRIGANSVAWSAEQVNAWVADKLSKAGEVRA